MSYLQDDKARLRRLRAREAITLAMQSRWEEAVEANQVILDSFPTDVDACKRLGRALMELGQYAQAREAYKKALELDPHNQIAKKNLARLAILKEAEAPVDRHRVAPHLFLEETGRAGVVDLAHTAVPEVLARLAAGDQVFLNVSGRRLQVVSRQGTYLGEVEPRHALRLLELILGGNKYSAAVAALRDGGMSVIIKETFQHPSQAGRPSFPIRETETFRPYIRDTMIKYELEDEEALPLEEEYREEPVAEEAAAEAPLEEAAEEET